MPAVLLARSTPAQEAKDKLTWFNGAFDDALTEARGKDTRVLLYFWNDSDDCKSLYGHTMQDDESVKRLSKLVLFSAQKGQQPGDSLIERFGIEHFPTMLLFVSGDQPDDALHGYINVRKLCDELDRIMAGKGTVSDCRKKASNDPKDLEAQFRYAEALRRVGDEKGYEGVVAAIRKKDKRGKTLVGARVGLSDLIHESREKSPPDFKPVISFLKRTKHKPVRWEGWNWAGWLQFDLGELDDARKSLQQAWKSCPHDGMLEFSQKLATAYWGVRDKLKTADKKFLMKVGEAQAKYAEKLEDPKAKGRPEGIETYESFLAARIDVMACCYYMGGKRKQALEAVERCRKLDPKNEAYKQREEQFKEGK